MRRLSDIMWATIVVVLLIVCLSSVKALQWNLVYKPSVKEMLDPLEKRIYKLEKELDSSKP